MKTGTYDIVPDFMKDSSILSARYFSQLILNADRTFTYKYRTSVSCFLWYDSEGKWRGRNDTLVLTDTVMSVHFPMRFAVSDTSGDRILVSVRSKLNKPIQQAKVVIIFKATGDSIITSTDTNGKVEVDTKGRSGLEKGNNTSLADVVILVEYMSLKYNQLLEQCAFSKLSANVDYTVDEDARDEFVTRTTFYKITGNRLVFISQQFNKPDVNPARHLFGNYTFTKN